jgi:predicted O-methyltransferase YrrM
LPPKAAILRRYRAVARSPWRSLTYLLFDRELDNFTYDISNTEEMVDVIASVLGTDRQTIRSFVAELEGDSDLRHQIATRLASRHDRNARMPFGRRLAWYAVVRTLKPGVVVETGIHDGLGSIALLRALDRNASEGADGRLISFDIDPASGWLIPPQLARRHSVVVGNSLDLIPETVASVDLFIHDSDHRYEYELAELEAIARVANRGAIYLSDNAHASTALHDFAIARSLEYTFWREVPARHFYPGAGLGIVTPVPPLAPRLNASRR